MNTFDRITQMHGDYNLTVQQLKEADKAAHDIVGAVRSRLQADREQTTARTAHLTAQAADLSRSETVRRVAEMELAQLRSRTVTATEEETAAFEAELRKAETAKKDAAEIQRQMRGALNEAQKSLAEISAAVMGDETPSLATAWADGVRHDFALLREEAKR